MPDINNAWMNQKFEAKLEACESSAHRLSDWELQFVESLRSNYDSREAVEELGGHGWNPSVKQWNQLSSIAERVGGN